MATLVLTAVGGAIGGPVGAALGGFIGQGADRALLGTRTRRGPRLTDLAVQTSRYGATLPRLYGTMRVAGTVVWSTDLIERTTREGGGKGRGSTTAYSYSASFAVALSSRPIRRVARIWSDGKLLRGAAGDWKSGVAAFRVHRGGEDQRADPLIASAVPDAPAHRGCAYAVFEGLELADFGNRIPSLTFEVVADEAPVAIGEIASDLSHGAIAGETTDMLSGFAADGDSVSGAAQVLAELCGGWFAPAEGGGVRLSNRMTAPAASLDGDAAVQTIRRPVDTVPATLTLSHYDPARDYQVGVQRARRPGAGWREDTVEAPAAFDAGGAKRIAAAMLLRAEASRTRRRVVTDASALRFAPGDAVRLPGERATWRVTRTQAEGMQVTLDLAAVSGTFAGTGAADPGRPVREGDVPAGPTVLHAVELNPTGDGAAPQLTVAAAGMSPAWRRAPLLLSRDDGATWQPIGTTGAPAAIGSLIAPVGRGAATLEDRRHAIEVQLLHDDMTLTTATRRAMDSGANTALLGNEVVQFREARQIAPARWRLYGLWRACRGSAAAHHDAGTRFVLLEPETSIVVPLPGARPGQHVLLMPQGVGDVAPAAVPAVLSGASIVPPAPVGLRVEGRDGDMLILTWKRRSRTGWRWEDGVDAPLGEERERYHVRLSGGDGTFEETVETPSVRVAVDRSSSGPVAVAVAQIGTWGRSAEAHIIVEEHDA